MTSRILLRHAMRPVALNASAAARYALLPSRYNSYAATPGALLRNIDNILIANRGEIALRVSRTASKYGIRTTTVYTEPDKFSQHALVTPFSVNIGPPNAYLDIEKIIKAAKDNGCDSVHPGYGFLSENSQFAKRCIDEGLVFIGPPPEAIEAMGNKSESKNIMQAAGVPCIPGYHGTNQDPSYLLTEAKKIGFPVLIKAVKGGGGKGMRIVATAGEFIDKLESAKTEAWNSFGDDKVLVEKYIITPRHIEVQIFADSYGNCVALGERDCSVQRRHQKILEESPAPHLDPIVRKEIWDKARAAALAVGYRGAGTVEFIFDNDTGEFFFMEMNTRLQVEHPVTEMVTGQDLVRWQLLVAVGHPLPLTQQQIEKQINGHAIEARIYAENPDTGFMPDSGKLIHLRLPVASDAVRIDAGFVEGDIVSPHYDPMIAKLIVKGPDRQGALTNLRAALEQYQVVGMETNIEFLKRLAAQPAFVKGEVETGFINKHKESLFKEEETPKEVYAQAALAMLLRDKLPLAFVDPFAIGGGGVGFMSGMQEKKTIFTTIEQGTKEGKKYEVTVKQISPNAYDLTVSDGAGKPTILPSITSFISPKDPSKIMSFYQHRRLETTSVFREDTAILHLFHLGKQYKLRINQPSWFEKALGIRDGDGDQKNSILAPMPCKVLKVSVKEGETVKKDQPLVVIESMKMETVIRSPSDGVVKKVLHEQGNLVRQGTALVLIE